MTISVNGRESEEVGMLLGKEGEAFFLREAPREESDGERMDERGAVRSMASQERRESTQQRDIEPLTTDDRL